MLCVVVETPMDAKTIGEFREKVEYSKLAMADCLKNGEAPIAFGPMYRFGFGDMKDWEYLAIKCSLVWATKADKVVIYEDLGKLPYQKALMAVCKERGVIVERRIIGVTRESIQDAMVKEMMKTV